MAPLVHLIRHAEAVHNANHDPETVDPGLTTLGHLQAERLANQEIKHIASRITKIVSSPSLRCIETALIAFRPVLELNNNNNDAAGRDSDENARARASPGPILLNADLMETDGSLVCNRPSNVEIISKSHGPSEISVNLLRTQGDYVGRVRRGDGPDYNDDSIQLRTTRARNWLRTLTETEDGSEIVVVSHGAYLLKMVDGEKAWDNAEMRTFSFNSWSSLENDNATLIRVRDENSAACHKAVTEQEIQETRRHE